MSYKIEIQNNFFVVTDTATGIEEIREVRDQVKWRVSGSIYSFFYNIANLVDQNSPNIIRLGENAKEFDFSEIVDSTETPFASRAIFNDLLNVNLGFMIRETSSVWGLITGDINDQTDLQTVLNGKFDVPTGDTTQYIAGDGTLITFPVAGQAGTLVREVKNKTGATLTKGTIVYINGANGNKPTVAKALATSDATSAQTFGFLQTDIANNAVGYAVVMGDLIGLDTSAITEGTQLYLSSTVAGNYTTTKQVAPAHLVYVGIVTRSHPTLGQIEVKIQNGYELDELHDVLISGQTDGQVLQFEGASGLWKNKTLATGLTVGSTAISSGTDGRVLFQNGGVLQQSANLFWDNTNSRLGINTISPQTGTSLDVNGRIKANVISADAVNNTLNTVTLIQFTGTGNRIYDNSSNHVVNIRSGNFGIGIGTDTPAARLDVRSQGALSTDIAFRVRNSANTLDIIRAQGDGSVFVGLGAGNVNTGANNSFFGIDAGRNNTTGGSNTAIGESALRNNTTGGNNTANGLSALSSNTTGNSNIAIGWSALINNTTGNNNVAVGFVSLAFTSGSSGNTALGFRSGRYHGPGSINNLTAASNSIFIGFDAAAAADNQTNQIVIGHNAVGLGSNTAVIGNSSTTLFRPFGNVAIGADTAGARLDVRAQGALSTDLAFRVRNSANTADWIKIDGTGAMTLSNAGGTGVILAFAKINNGSGYFYGDASSVLTYSQALAVNGVLYLQNGIGMQGYGKDISMNSGTISTITKITMQQSSSIIMRPDFNMALTENNLGLFIAPNNTANPTKKLIKLMDSTLTDTYFAVNGSGQTSIGTTSPNASAKVQIDSTTQGFLPPRMTNAQRTAIASPAVGLMVYCTDATEGLYVYKSTGWTFVI